LIQLYNHVKTIKYRLYKKYDCEINIILIAKAIELRVYLWHQNMMTWFHQKFLQPVKVQLWKPLRCSLQCTRVCQFTLISW